MSRAPAPCPTRNVPADCEPPKRAARIRIYVHPSIYTCMHACIHTYIHTYIHMYVCI
jgi:hypothetical protein